MLSNTQSTSVGHYGRSLLDCRTYIVQSYLWSDSVGGSVVCIPAVRIVPLHVSGNNHQYRLVLILGISFSSIVSDTGIMACQAMTILGRIMFQAPMQLCDVSAVVMPAHQSNHTCKEWMFHARSASVTALSHQILYLAGQLVNFAIQFLTCHTVGMTNSCGCCVLQQLKVNWPVWFARGLVTQATNSVDECPWLPVVCVLSNGAKEGRVAVYCLYQLSQ
jgi:hypothetical protein